MSYQSLVASAALHVIGSCVKKCSRDQDLIDLDRSSDIDILNLKNNHIQLPISRLSTKFDLCNLSDPPSQAIGP